MNTYGGSDYDEEEIEKIHERFKLGKVSYRDTAISKSVHPVICYDYIDITEGNYGFNQGCLNSQDAKKYFEKIKLISSSTIQDLIDKGERNLHLYPSGRGRRLTEALKKIFGCKYINDKDYPDIYHFALYTNKDAKANRDRGIKSPRIHFLVASHGMIYILFYDPYHEINP